ncbi:MAG: hypothetical protein GQ529_03520, partial [Methyloprofundus sp.]|nr:hypothetical protein [Methyloprofundus sp.]
MLAANNYHFSAVNLILACNLLVTISLVSIHVINNYLMNILLRSLLLRFFSAGFGLLLLSGNLFAGDANIAWDASPSSNVGGYILSYGKSSGNFTSSIDVGNTTTYNISGLQEGDKYYAAMKAYDVDRTTESGYSNEVNWTVPVTEVLTVDFTASATSGAPGMLVSFTPITTGEVTSWEWNLPGSSATN